MRVKSWEFWMWIAFLLLTALVGEGVIPAGTVWLKLAMAVLGVMKTITTMIGRPVVDSATPPKPGLTTLLLVLGVGALLAGCDPVPAMWKSTATLATATSAGYRVLDQVDDQQQAAAHTKAELDAWLAKYDSARKALDAAYVVAESAPAAIHLVELSTSKSKAAAEYIAKITALGLDVARALSDIGVKLPGAPSSVLLPAVRLAAAPSIYDQRFEDYCACDDLECVAGREARRGRYDGPRCLPGAVWVADARPAPRPVVARGAR
jgi:hypothetical protein